MDVIAEAEARRRAYYEEPVRFTVKGRGVFPADMLRHDRCYPVDGDINHITNHVLSGVAIAKIVLVTPKRSAVTPARWRSFGWVVTEIGGEEVF